MKMRRCKREFSIIKLMFALILLAESIHCLVKNPLPNIIVVLMDDQDLVLGGMEPMAKTNKFVKQRNGTVFKNAFVSTPVCCPSRSSILTGKYVHNHGTINNTANGNCSSFHWQTGPETKTMATYLQNEGYRTFYGGKYLNQYGKKETGGVERVPPGYHRWVGLVGNSRYYNYTLSVDGEARHHSDDYGQDYLTDVIANEAVSFIEKDDERPVFALIAPPACHSPFTAAPQHAGAFAGERAPRWPNFNRRAENGSKHWLLRQPGSTPANASAVLPDEVIDRVDHVFRQRWRTLLSVDDMVERIVELLSASGKLDNTYFVFTSDHGYHMGQFGMPVDKRLPYETDLRVPLVIVPPPTETDDNNNNNYKHKRRTMAADELVVVSVDLAPTVLDMARIQTPDDMDGTSLLPLVNQAAPIKWMRSSFLVEYHGEADLDDVDAECEQDPNTTLCMKEFDCKCQDASNNTYVCVRTMHRFEDTIYCAFFDDEQFVEFYDLRSDPYEMINRAQCVPHADRLESNDVATRRCFNRQHEKYMKLLADFTQCTGRSCLL